MGQKPTSNVYGAGDMDSVPNEVHPRMLSDFVKECQQILADLGDMPVVAAGINGRLTSAVEVDTLPNFYGGGWLDPATPAEEGHARIWLRSRTNKVHKEALEIMVDEPRRYLSHDYCQAHHPDHYVPPELRDTVDGEPVSDL